MSSYSNYFKKQVGAQFNLDWVRKDSDFVYNQLRHVKKIVPFDSDLDAPVLEIGSGMGRLALLLYEAGFSDYTGLEIDPKAQKFSQTLGFQ
jgi:16S rRNA A1518/A1519 N6-dimethyltransferase RsmA/KsgA/DIM1 with predicted DNA glycosylase/AP lyase activity